MTSADAITPFRALAWAALVAWALSTAPAWAHDDEAGMSNENAASAETSKNTALSVSGAISRSISVSVGGGAARAARRAFAPGTRHARTGLSAGEEASAFSAWGTFDYMSSIISPEGSKRETDAFNGVLGADYAVTDDIIVGLALGVTKSETTAKQLGGDYTIADTAALTASPYAAYVVNENFYIDAAAGYSGGETDNDAYDAADVFQYRFTDRDSRTWFASGNLNYMRYWQGVDFLATFGFAWSHARLDPAEDTEGVNRNRQVSVSRIFQTGLQAGYPLEDALPLPVTPYGRAVWIYDMDGGDTGPHGARLAAGFDVFATDAITASVEGSALVGKNDQEEYGAMANINVAF